MPDEPVLLDTQAIAAALGVEPGVIRLWAHRGKLRRRGTDHRGRTLYDLDEAFEVQKQMHQRQQRQSPPAES